MRCLLGYDLCNQHKRPQEAYFAGRLRRHDVIWQAAWPAMRADMGGENKKVGGYVILCP